MHKQDFYSCKRLEEVTLTCEKEFASVFCGGNTAQARGMLLPQKLDESVDWGQFQLGYHLGMAALLVNFDSVYLHTYIYIHIYIYTVLLCVCCLVASTIITR
jgi:hypothetical protein